MGANQMYSAIPQQTQYTPLSVHQQPHTQLVQQPPPPPPELTPANTGDAGDSQQLPAEQEGRPSINASYSSVNTSGVNDASDDVQIEQRFRDVLQFIADRADVDLNTPVSHLGDTRVHLLSEQFQPKSEFGSLTTTAASARVVVGIYT